MAVPLVVRLAILPEAAVDGLVQNYPGQRKRRRLMGHRELVTGQPGRLAEDPSCVITFDKIEE